MSLSDSVSIGNQTIIAIWQQCTTRLNRSLGAALPTEELAPPGRVRPCIIENLNERAGADFDQLIRGRKIRYEIKTLADQGKSTFAPAS